MIGREDGRYLGIAFIIAIILTVSIGSLEGGFSFLANSSFISLESPKPLLLLAILLSPLLMLRLLRKKRLDHVQDDKDLFRQREPKWLVLCLLLCVVAAIIFVSLRFLYGLVPQGFDTPYYVYAAEEVRATGVGVLVSLPHQTVVVLALAILVTIKDPQTTAIVLPFVVSIIYAVISFFAFTRASFPSWASSIIVITALASGAFMRISYDLFGQMILMSLMLIVFAEMSNHRYRTAILFAIVMIFADAALATIALAFIVLTGIIESRKAKFAFDRRFISLLIIAIGLFTFVAVAASSYSPISIVKVFGTIMASQVTPFASPSSWDWYIYVETVPIYVLALLGALRMSWYPKNSFVVTILMWNPFVYFIAEATGYSQAYRLISMSTIPLLAGLGVVILVSLLSRHIRTRHMLVNGFYRVISVAIIAIIIGLAFLPISYNPSLTYYNQSLAGSLSNLENYIGFNNRTAFLFVDQSSLVQSYFWYNVYLGNNVYFGNITNLLAGQPDFYQNPDGVPGKSVLLVQNLSFPEIPSLLRAFSVEVGDGIFIFNATRYNTFLANATDSQLQIAVNSSYMDNGTSGWQLWKGTDSTSSTNSASFGPAPSTDVVVGETNHLTFVVTSDSLSIRYSLSGSSSSKVHIEFYLHGDFVGYAAGTLTPGSNARVIMFLPSSLTFDQARVILYGNGQSGNFSLNDIVYFP